MYRLDHFLSYTNAKNIDDHLNWYEQLGFVRVNQTVQHHPGLRTGFIYIGTEYIEFLWVEDKDLFDEQASDEAKEMIKRPEMFSIGIIIENMENANDYWKSKGYEINEIREAKPRGADEDSEPVWKFLTPPNLEYGVSLFGLQYLNRPDREQITTFIHPNQIYAIDGITIVEEKNRETLSIWEQVFEQTGQKNILEIDRHNIHFMNKSELVKKYGSIDIFELQSSKFALLHLLSKDLVETIDFLKDNAEIMHNCEEGFLVKTNSSDGFVFHISEQDPEIWKDKIERITNKSIRILNKEEFEDYILSLQNE